MISSRGESSMPSNDDHKPSIDADWRSFRAKLVAAEKSRPKEPTSASSLEDLHTLVDQRNPITVGDKWAQTIHKSEKGCLLLATQKLGRVHIFERTIIWVLSTGPLGPSAIILNRPSLMSIKETRSTALDVAGTFSDRPLEEGLFLVRPKGGDDAVGRSGVFDEVMKGLYYGSKEGVGCAAEMVKRDMVGLGEFMFFDGYCSPSVIDLRSAGSVGLWEKFLRLMARRKVR